MRLTKYRGKWCISFKEGDKYRRISTGTADREVAERVARDLHGVIEKSTNPTVTELWEKAKADKAGKPVANNMHFHWKALAPFFGNHEPHQITVKDCRDYVKMRQDTGKAPSTISTELKHLRSCLRWAEKTGLIERAPFIEVSAESAPRDRYLTRVEFKKLLNAASAPHISLAMILLLSTAGRVSAVLELTWDRVDFVRGKIQLKTTNIGKGRAIVPMTEQVQDELKRAFVLRTSDYIIEYAGGSVKDIRRGLGNAAQRAGIAGVTPHVFRHTAAVWMAEDGHSMEEIAQFLGHRDVNVTRRVYAKFSPDHLRNLAATLSY
ncbi:MAG: tyrosine-type recombinase/integrase [Rhodobacteraceae bacterium]|nr:tyrosine-type recombinase/integrase [Paracoccaceae bacterium]